LLRLTDPHGFVVKAPFAVVLSVAHLRAAGDENDCGTVVLV